MMREWLRPARTLADDAPIRLRFENEKIGERGQKLEGRERFQLLLGRKIVGALEHPALLMREGEILPGPGGEFVVRNEAMKFHAVQARDGGELVIFNEQKNLVIRALAAVACGQKDFRSIVRIPPAQVFVAQKGLELVVEGCDFGASHLVRERKRNVSPPDLRRNMSMARRGVHLARPEPVGGPGR